MSTDFQTEPQPAVGTLLGGIVDDARQLFVEQMTLFQVEIKNDVQRIVMAVIPLAVGGVVSFAGLLILAISAAEFLCWLAPELPYWISYGAVGTLIMVVGGALLLWAKSKLAAISPVPDTALKGLKENLQWKTKN